ncbi:hypothetical protein BD410DRAFT_808079 [Rickenella mellea]|uniref:Uncharacterized protein n=1 Tax=Rickenella mellea TaxID=50990 RepID=A0A4Y7PNB3_9AGAM|nr:hypothetical protein BD410DRAFT_808079 [Rickenella mellea]
MYSVKTLQLSAVDIGERYSNVAHTQDVQQSIFLALQIMGGHILLPLIIAYIEFGWPNLMPAVFCSIYSKRTISESLSLHPGPSVCLVQAALINGIQAMTSSTTLALSAHIWDIFRQSRRNALPADYILNYGIRNTSLLVVPLVVFLAFATATTVRVAESSACRFRGVYMFSVIVTLAAIVFKGRAFDRFDLATAIKPSSIPPSRRGGDFTFESGIDLLEAGLPLVAGIILGTQKVEVVYATSTVQH